MKKWLTAGTLGLLTAVASIAAPVDFATNATFNCNGVSGCVSGGSFATVTQGTVVLTLNYNSNTQIGLNVIPNAGPTGTNFGSVDVSTNAGPTDIAAFNLAGITLSLGILQGPNPFGPVATSGYTGTLTGFLSMINGNPGGFSTIGFVPLINSVTSGGDTINYNIIGSPYPISIGNSTSFQGTVTWDQVAGIPEPGTFGLIGLSLAGLGLLSRRLARR
jgi:hypothetical protein